MDPLLEVLYRADFSERQPSTSASSIVSDAVQILYLWIIFISYFLNSVSRQIHMCMRSSKSTYLGYTYMIHEAWARSVAKLMIIKLELFNPLFALLSSSPQSTMSEQPDGFYPRLNGQILQSGEHANKIVSLVGKVEMFDGASIQLKCADGVIANVVCEPDTDVVQGSVYEFVGAAGEDGSLQVSLATKLD
jgi:hypothetical protein